MRCSTVSVMLQPVQRSCSITFAAVSGSNCPTSHTERVPVAMNAIAPVCRPDTWNSGLVMS